MADKPEFNGWEHAKQSLAFVGAHVPSALKVSGLWLVLIVGTVVGGTPLAIWLMQNNEEFASFVRSSDERVVQLILLAPTIVLMAIGWPSVAVAWHRFVLRREQPAILPFAPLRGGLYLLLSSAFYLIVWILPGAALAIVFVTLKQANYVVLLIWVAIFAGLLALSMRFSLKLPAIAVSDRSMTFARSWTETEEIWPGMLWGTVVLTVPLFFVTKALDIAASRTGEDQLEIALLLGAINIIAIFVGLLLYATFLSLCYQRAVGDTSTTFD